MKYLTNSGLSYFLNKIKAYLTSSTYLNSIGIPNSDIDDIADDAGYSSGSLPASEDIFITGDIIPNTDNSVDLGASSKNIKMLYTKGITIDNKTVDTDANGNLVYDGNIVDTIEEQGAGYIRYSNGLQICWGTMAITWSLQEQYTTISFAKSFEEIPSVSLTHTRSGFSPYTYSEISATFKSTFLATHITTNADSSTHGELSWTAIGRWK